MQALISKEIKEHLLAPHTCNCVKLKHQSKTDRRALLMSKTSNGFEKEVVFREPVTTAPVSGHLVVITQTEWWLERVTL